MLRWIGKKAPILQNGASSRLPATRRSKRRTMQRALSRVYLLADLARRDSLRSTRQYHEEAFRSACTSRSVSELKVPRLSPSTSFTGQ